MFATIPKVLVRNRYRIIRRLGEGGMGTVFEGQDDLLDGAPVALKCMWPTSAQPSRLVETLRSEFRILATLHHPLLCRVYDFGGLPAQPILDAPSRGPGYFLCRELVAGEDLATAGSRSIIDVCRLFAQAAAGLEVLHRAGLRHGDFKPANVIVSATGVKLIDFGLTASEASGERGGTLAYAAPEILRGAPIDRRADLYALGVALFEVLTGELPSGQRRGSALSAWHSSGKRPDLRSLCPTAPEALAELVAKLLHADPNHRLPTAAETEAALLRVAGGPSAEATPTPLVIEPLDRGIATQAEIAALRRCQNRGGPALIEIIGAPGSGRSAALTELVWRLELAGVEAVRGDASRRHSAHAAIDPALEQLAAITGAPLPTGNATDLSAALDRVQVPTAIVLDDFDDADPGSRSLLLQAAGRLASSTPIAFVIVRDESAAVTSGALAESFRCPPLDGAQVALLTERALGRDDSQVAERVHAHTNGNLLHVVSTLQSIVESGKQLGDLSSLPLPDRLAEAARAELADLPLETRRVVAALAVSGAATAQTLAAITGTSPDLIVGILDDPTLAIERARDGRYVFARAALASAVLSALPTVEQLEIHRAAALAPVKRSRAALLRHQIGAAITSDVANGIDAALEELSSAGDHVGALALGQSALAMLESAGQAPVALRVRLGELARLVGDIDGAQTLLEPVLETTADDAHVARASLALARALDAGGAPERAEELFTRAARGPDAIAAEAIRDHAHSLVRRGKSAEALELATTSNSTDPHLAVAAAYARGVLGESTDAVATLERMADEATQDDDRALEAAALHLAGLAAYRTGDWKHTRELQQRALVAAEDVGDVIRVGTLRMNLAAMDQSEGAWARALEGTGQAVSLLHAAGARTYALMARRNRAQLLLEIGASEQARRELEAARAEAIALELPVHEIGIDALLGIARARAGDIERGRAALVSAEQRFRALGDERRAGETLLDLAELELDFCADPVAASAALSRAAEDETVNQHPGRHARLVVGRALVHAFEGRDVETERLLLELDTAERALERQGGEPLRAELHRRAARAADLIGATELTERHSDEALTILTKIASALLPEQRITFWQDARRRELRSEAASARTVQAVGRTESSLSASLGSERVFQLLAIYSQLSSEENPDKLLSAAMEQAALLVGANRGFLLLSRGGDLIMVANRNLPSSQLESIRHFETQPASMLANELPYSRTVAEEVFRTGEPVIGDVREDSRFAGAASVHSLSAPSVLCVPACAGGEVVGALYLESNTSGLTLGPTDGRLLAAFGDQVAVLLREAELKRQLKQRAEQLERAQSEVEALLAERTQLLADRTEQLSVAVRENSKLNRRLLKDGGAFGLVGSSVAMERVYELIDRVGVADVSVLIVGESGTGKELVARAIHSRSARSGKPMVAVNCGALPQTLLESELFGHRRGAFTGAARDRRGLFEMADGSTLFLDEVSETPPRMQAALLRAIQEGVVTPVGGVETRIDVRVVCASNRDLHTMAEKGEFREDLLYRLEVLTLEIPPLRERRSDIPLLCEHFLKSLRERTGRAELAITSEALRLLFDHEWPGNVRQLEHALTSAAVMAPSDHLGPEDFDVLLGSIAPAVEVRAQSERAEILAALERCGWNRSKAARALGMPRRTFYRRLTKYGIQ